MATFEQPMDSGSPSTSRILTILGTVLVIFSVVISVLVLYVIPSACNFVGSLQLLLLGFMFVGGVITLIIGRVLAHKGK